MTRKKWIPPDDRGREPSSYDVQMIRDFIEHLKWELRTALFESSGNERINPELQEQLAKYMEKYRSVVLPVIDIDRAGSTEAEFKEAIRRLSVANIEVKQHQLEVLESLSSLFNRALQTASMRTRGSQLPGIKLTVGNILNLSDDELRDAIRGGDDV